MSLAEDREISRGRQMENLRYRIGGIGRAAGAALLLAGCGLTGMGGTTGAHVSGAAVTITQAADPSALLAVTAGPASGPAVVGLVAGTARPNEDLRILEAATPARTIVASDSPAPAEMVIAGPPAAPAGGQTAYQSAQYAKKLMAWRAERAADTQADAVQTRERVSAWVSGLKVSQRFSGLAEPRGDQGGLAAESAVAASALAEMNEDAGNPFGDRRVIVLFTTGLNGPLPAGELTGDDVIAVTSSLPTAAAASAAQAELLGAGAAQAAVIGPEVTAAQFAALVSAGLSQGAAKDTVSTPVLFANDSAALDAAATGQLTRLLGWLRESGVTAVINGYASTSGTAQANYVLSYQRATRVADFFESHGIPEASLIIVGHGATDAFGSGSPGANRRVLVVTEKPAGVSPTGLG
jgi:outer membrane protein OmpA-like peptidoglycan-associated protein